MKERTVTITNKLGLHARAAAKLVTAASSFSSDIDIVKDGQKVNGKSIMGILTLAAARGDAVILEADGPDEEQAVSTLRDLVRSGFEENAEE